MFVFGGLAFGAPTLEAAPRQVVVINAAKDQSAGAAAAARVRRVLAADADLEPLASGDLARGFEAALSGQSDQQLALADAKKLYAEAVELFEGQFKPKPAKNALGRAEERLLSVAPNEAVTQQLADINFLYGRIHLREQNRGLALDAFFSCRILDPNRGSLNPAAFKPDIVKTFDEAAIRTRKRPSATLEISATFDVPIYIDGVEAGNSPLKVELIPGKHYVVAASPQYRTAAIAVDLADGETVSRKLELLEIARDEQARNLRSKMIGDGRVEGETLLSLAREGVNLAGVDAAIVITDGDSGPLATVYDRPPDRLSYSRPADAEVEKILGLLIDVPQPVLPDRPDLFDDPTRTPTPWIKTTPGIATLVGGGVVATTITVVVLNAVLGGVEPGNRSLTFGGFGGAEP